MSDITLQHYLILSALLFSIGLTGMLIRKNILMILASIELILNSANLSFVAFSCHLGDLSGQAVVFFTMIIAAAEVTVGLAMIILLFRSKGNASVDELRSMRW